MSLQQDSLVNKSLRDLCLKTRICLIQLCNKPRTETESKHHLQHPEDRVDKAVGGRNHPLPLSHKQIIMHKPNPIPFPVHHLHLCYAPLVDAVHRCMVCQKAGGWWFSRYISTAIYTHIWQPDLATFVK